MGVVFRSYSIEPDSAYWTGTTNQQTGSKTITRNVTKKWHHCNPHEKVNASGRKSERGRVSGCGSRCDACVFFRLEGDRAEFIVAPPPLTRSHAYSARKVGGAGVMPREMRW